MVFRSVKMHGDLMVEVIFLVLSSLLSFFSALATITPPITPPCIAMPPYAIVHRRNCLCIARLIQQSMNSLCLCAWFMEFVRLRGPLALVRWGPNSRGIQHDWVHGCTGLSALN
ncbi:hypothetical protein RIF29_33334 [Crotalaria pallida]|uniref:Uncharacterized protein n=1 Tax=Crotalaria pallida TaxID=3830 RepID=A0AAN9HWR7_CROPI